MKHLKLRRAVIDTARALNRDGLSRGTSGNVSARTPEGFLITPSGVSFETLRPGDIVPMDVKAETDAGEKTGGGGGRLRPSSEWRFHHDLMVRRPEVDAVVHVHSPFATALSCLRRGIPAFHYMVAVAGGDSIRCADYATFGTAELSHNTLAAIEDRKACLLANHGVVAVGETLDTALDIAGEVESLAMQYTIALRIGDPVLLDREEMATILALFKDYGPRS